MDALIEPYIILIINDLFSFIVDSSFYTHTFFLRWCHHTLL